MQRTRQLLHKALIELVKEKGFDAVTIMMANLEATLTAAFPGIEPTMPLALLKPYLVNAQLAFIDWWVRSEVRYTPEQVATTLHQLQRSIIRAVYRLR